jgi:hypothetical protein
LPFVRCHGAGGRVHYAERGESHPGRRPVLLIHGAGASSAIWMMVMARLGRATRAIAIDLPGHGPSPAREQEQEQEQEGASARRRGSRSRRPSRAGDDTFERYRAAIIEFVGRYWGQRLGEVQVGKVLFDMLGILRRHRVRVNPTFTVVNIAIAVTEGIGKQLDPTLDLMAEAIPYFLSHPVDAQSPGA